MSTIELIEEWLDIPDYEGLYSASTFGRLLARNGINTLNPYKNPRGYYHVSLYKEKIETNYSVATLIARTFLGPRPDGMEVCHEDGNPSNNRIDNLRYDTHQNNLLDKLKHGTWQSGEQAGNAKLSNNDIIEIYRLRYLEKMSIFDIAKLYKITGSDICQIVNNKLKFSNSNELYEQYKNIYVNCTQKLTPEKVKQIRYLYKNTTLNQYDLAERFNVRQNTIWQIVNRKTWKWVND